ncbi:MAG: SRPBCC family protein [Saprospiraceae bacterium]|nr:SRPBCC family protein [Saprospiraceae bacterium]
MSILKKIGLGVIGLFALLLIAALFVRKQYQVERKIVINAPDSVVYDYVKNLRNQNNWVTWNSMDPNIKHTYTGNDGELGSSVSWTSTKVGNGSQTIKSLSDNKRVDLELKFDNTDASPTYITTTANGAQTDVAWGMQGEINYPMNLMIVMMDMEGMIGKEFDMSLNNLKKILESK